MKPTWFATKRFRQYTLSAARAEVDMYLAAWNEAGKAKGACAARAGALLGVSERRFWYGLRAARERYVAAAKACDVTPDAALFGTPETALRG